jgi:succinate dehydrogenase / fumarate reductase, cytochrome b subunit
MPTSRNGWFLRAKRRVAGSFFQHLFSGLRHLVMDMGAGYELNANRNWAIIVFIASITATGLLALYVAWKALGV